MSGNKYNPIGLIYLFVIPLIFSSIFCLQVTTCEGVAPKNVAKRHAFNHQTLIRGALIFVCGLRCPLEDPDKDFPRSLFPLTPADRSQKLREPEG